MAVKRNGALKHKNEPRRPGMGHEGLEWAIEAREWPLKPRNEPLRVGRCDANTGMGK